MGRFYSITAEYKGFTDDVIVSARHVTGIDLGQRGGFALLGNFVKNKKGNGQVSVHSELPLVITWREPNEQVASDSRFAILFLPPSNKLKGTPRSTFKMTGSNQQIDVIQGAGTLFGQYFGSGFSVLDVDLVKDCPKAGNPFYQIAIHLEHLSSTGCVKFPIDPKVIPSYNPKESIHDHLPILPTGWEWGPEIGGLMTVKKSIDPYTFFPLHVLLDELSPDAEFFFEFLQEQAGIANSISRTYAIAAKLSGKDGPDDAD